MLLSNLVPENSCVSLVHAFICVHALKIFLTKPLIRWPLAPGKSTLLDILAQRKGGAVTGQVRQLSAVQPPAD